MKQKIYMTIAAVSLLTMTACGSAKVAETTASGDTSTGNAGLITITEAEETETAPVETTAEADVLPSNDYGYTVSYEREIDDIYEYGVITAANEAGEEVWTYTSEGYEEAQLYATAGIGACGNLYYFTEDGAVKALNIEDGSEAWSNDEFGGYMADIEGESCLTADGRVFIGGGMGPALFVADADGNTLLREENFGLETGVVNPVFSIEGNTLYVSIYDGTYEGAEEHTAALDLTTMKWELLDAEG